MTILVDARPMGDPLAGGVTRVAKSLALALAEAMPETTFLWQTTGMQRPHFDRIPKNATLQHATLPNKLWSSLAFTQLASFDRLASSATPDLLLLFNLGFVGTPKLPYALVVHDLSFLIEPRWFSWRGRLWHKAVHAKRLIRGARFLFAVSACTKQDLVRLLGIEAERITVIPLGIEPAPNSMPLPDTLEGKRFCLALGANDTRKNSACAIEAVSTLRQDPAFADVELVVTGTPSFQKTSPSWITQLRKPNDAALASLQKNAAAFLYPSWYEGFGLPLHEAARFGTPCVATTSSALPETAPHGTLFAPPAKPHVWTAALKLILSQPEAHRTKTSLHNWQPAARIIQETLSREI